ncbi:acyl-CoA dehydrogenase family protein [Streptomyces sp. NPDC021098]|uniref:acyl-CoA dehydrogenase family protein n=1 Tax=unclassified Streptomyces TaxID=2593676 RepID=UPI0037A12C3F
MDAALSEEQEEIRRTLRELLRGRCGGDEVKAAVRTEAGYDEALWGSLARRLGLPGLALPAAYGGVGCGTVELALACEEAGRALLPSPLLATAVLAAPLIAALGTDAQRAELLPPIAGGELTAALAVPGRALSRALGLDRDTDGEADGRDEADWAGGGRAGGVQARAGGGGWRLYGQVEQVLDGHSARLLLVAARTGGYARGRTLVFAVRAGAAGLVRTRLTALDETRSQARIELRDAPAELLGEDGADVAGALAGLGGPAAAALAAEAVGAADAALARTLGHVRTREQFGRPIGSFQAVKHRLADVYVAVQAARSAAYYAAWAADGPQGPVAGPLALASALEAQRAAAGEAVQLHGGIGITWEHDAHLYLKRAASDELLFGPAHRLRARAADRDGLFAPAAAAAVTV